ncbi:CHAT domain-containing protein [Phaeodactylibacter xiamenensis]|uniref:CHAT domain-containing protein n=1 Tax=Phaeodactylibacter xiamenensis TaxID=1524460 RepID=UPI003BAA0BD5
MEMSALKTVAAICFFSFFQLSAQTPIINLEDKYPYGTLLNKDNLEEYGLDIKTLLQAQKQEAAVEHVNRFFLPQLTSLEKLYPKQLLIPLVWGNFLFSSSRENSSKAKLLGELYLSIIRSHPDWINLEDQFTVMWRTAIAYRELNEIEKSENLFDNCFYLLDNESLPDEDGLRGDLYSSLATLKLNKRQILDTKPILDSAKIYCSSYRKSCYSIYILNLADYYESVNERDKAENILLKFINEIENHPNRFTPATHFSALRDLANVYYYLGQYQKTIEYYQDALEIPNIKASNRVNSYITLGATYSWSKNYHNAENYLKKALEFQKYAPNSPFPYDPFESNLQRLLINIYFLAQNEQYHYADGGTLDNLRASYDYQEQYLDLLEYMSKNLSPTSSRYFIDRFYYMYEEAIYVRYKLYEETQDAEYLEDAFRVAGRGKAIHVREAAQNAATEQIFPARLLQRRYDLRKRYVSLENRLYEQQEAGNASSALADSSLQAKNEYLRFLDSLEQAFPTMQQMWDIPEPPEPKLVQKQLREDNRAMVLYFIGYQYVFLFLLDGEDIVLYNTKIPEGLSGQVSKMRDALYEWALHPSDDLVEQYTSSAHWLYKKLLQPVDSLLPQRLLIVPDNCVAYIPFDVLLREKPVPETPFQDYPYLIQDHQISYAYSPYDFTKKPQGKRHKRAAVLGFAPSFRDSPAIPETVANRRGEFGPLLANQDEVRQISDFFLVRKFEGEAATREAFLENASYYKALHLATHAKANDKKGDYSYLCFTEVSDDTTTSNRLYASELYLMNLSADMVVLSACETGLGELSKGEGVISLSQAFSKAGARSLITTLWRVSDQASATLMNSFYKHLHSGKTKDAALRNAKLDYLHEATGRGAHPFFWAGYVAQGDMAPLQLSSGYFIWWICLFLLVLFVILGGLIRSKRHKAHAKN